MFTHLRVKSEFSIEEGLLRIEEIVKLAKDSGSGSVALTDFQNTGGLAKFHLECQKVGLKPLSGAEITLHDEENSQSGRVLLLAKNLDGYSQINEVLTALHKSGVGRFGPELSMTEFLAMDVKDLICLSGFSEGFLDNCFRNDENFDSGQLDGVNFSQGAKSLVKVSSIFPGRFYVELQRSENLVINRLSEVHERFARAGKLPVVATCPNLYLDQGAHNAHRVRHLISTNKSQPKDWGRARVYYDKSNWVDAQEMRSRFADIPQAIENTGKIASECNHLINAQKPDLPRFPTPKGQSESEYLKNLVYQGVERRLALLYDREKTPQIYQADLARYRERVDYELSVIGKMGFEGYFLIVQDYIGWAKSREIAVGPARGSGAGSLVAYSLGITEVDPMVYGLLFERFLNPERVSMPDIDTDFCSKRRGEVISYLREKYGESHTTQIRTYSRFKDASVVDSVGRTREVNESVKTRIKKLVEIHGPEMFSWPDEKIPADIKEAMPLGEYRSFFEMCKNLMGVIRGVGTHPAGVIISGKSLSNYTGLMGSNASDRGTMMSFEDLEIMGLVKLDLLGIKQITLLSAALASINSRRQSLGLSERISIDSIPQADPAVYDLLSQGNTVAIFQLEGGAPKSLSSKMKPNNLGEIAAINALIRPGPANAKMDEQYINRRNYANETGEHDTSWYAHEKLKPVLESTYGVMVYQEQVMRIAQEMAGYTLAQADTLRKVIGKKKTEDMSNQRDLFVSGSAARGVDEKLATHVFDLIEKFGDYGFNLSHSVAYSVISYQTAWLKAHFPAEYMAAALDSAISHADKRDEEAKVNVFLDDVRRNCFVYGPSGPTPVEVLGPSVNQSFAGFTPVYDSDAVQAGKISFGLAAIKKIGFDLADSISNERMFGPGKFSDLDDFLRRCSSFLTASTLESLIKSGALDEFNHSRIELLDQALLAFEYYKKVSARKTITDPPAYSYKFEGRTDDFDDLAEMESESLGFFFKFDPLKSAGRQIQKDFGSNLSGLESRLGETVTVAGYISSIKTRKTAKKEVMADVTIKDTEGAIGGTVFPRTYNAILEKSRALEDEKIFQKGAIVKVTGKVEYNAFRDEIGLIVYEIDAYKIQDNSEDLRKQSVGASEDRCLDLIVTGNKDATVLSERLQKYATESPDGWRVRLLRNSPEGFGVEKELNRRIHISPELKETLRLYFGDENFFERRESVIKPDFVDVYGAAPPRCYALRHLFYDQFSAQAIQCLPDATVQRDPQNGSYALEGAGESKKVYSSWGELYSSLKLQVRLKQEEMFNRSEHDVSDAHFGEQKI